MPQILVFTAVAIVGWIGYKAFLREAGRVRARVRRAEDEARNRAWGTLVRDPETGEYHVQKD